MSRHRQLGRPPVVRAGVRAGAGAHNASERAGLIVNVSNRRPPTPPMYRPETFRPPRDTGHRPTRAECESRERRAYLVEKLSSVRVFELLSVWPDG